MAKTEPKILPLLASADVSGHLSRVLGQHPAGHSCEQKQVVPALLESVCYRKRDSKSEKGRREEGGGEGGSGRKEEGEGREEGEGVCGCDQQ